MGKVVGPPGSVRRKAAWTVVVIVTATAGIAAARGSVRWLLGEYVNIGGV